MAELVIMKKGESPIVSWIKRRVLKENNSVTIAFVGKTGSGKTYSAIRLAQMIDPDFSIDQISFNGIRGMLKIKRNPEMKKKKIKIAILEELQVTNSNRAFQSGENKMLTKLLSTFRHQNWVLFLTQPFIEFIDSSTRKLIHGKFVVSGVDKAEKKTKVSPLLNDHNISTGKEYWKFLFVHVKGSGTHQFAELRLGLPTKEILIPYEKVKQEFSDALDAEMERDLDKLDEKNKPAVIDKRVRLTPLQNDIFTAFSNGMSTKELALEYKCTERNINTHLQRSRLKGYYEKEFDLRKQSESDRNDTTHTRILNG